MERHFPDVAPRTRQMAERIEDIHRSLTGNAVIRARDLLGGVASPTDVPAAFEGKDAERVRRVLGVKSATLLAWPATTAGQWVARPELTSMLDHIAKLEGPPLVLLGQPGSGKSALLAKLGGELATRGTTLLAIKADALPRSVVSLADLDAEMGVPESLDRCLVRLATEGPVVLLIDQLDALADLMDQHGGRLSALLSLVALVRNHRNLAIILSCREFEFRHDARLTSLGATSLHLPLLSWDAVEPLLRGAGLDPTNWSPEFREVLCAPQHLDLFLRYLADAGAAYPSYHDMLEEVFRRRILSGASGQRDGDALHAVARAMVEEEDLWVPSARFDAYSDAVGRLEAAGFLVRSGRRLGFRHQTLFDFVRARAFVADGESVVDYALARQSTIFARPTVWSALTYLRASDPSGYERQLVQLWTAPDLRLHLRWLLRDFVGKQAHPTDGEARLLLSVVTDPKEGARALRATIGSTGWFDRLLPGITDLMRAPDPLGWTCGAVLRSVVNVRRDIVLPLVAKHWTVSELRGRASLVLDGLTVWTDAAVDIAEEIVPTIESWSFLNLAKSIDGSLPRRLPGFLLRRLDVVLAEARAEGSPGAALKRVLADPAGMHGFGALLLSAPAANVKTLWPWFAQVAALTVAGYEHRGGYQYDDGSLLERFGSSSHDGDRPGPAFANAIAAWAGQDPDAFVSFASGVISTDLEVLHHFLAAGYLAVAVSHPSVVLDYLLGDDRRFQLGTYDNRRKVTVSLIAAVAPQLPPLDLQRLVDAIRRWTQGRALADYDLAHRMQASKWVRQDQLDLLMAVPEASRTQSLTRLIQEELRAVGEPSRGGGIVVRDVEDVAMTADSMAKARDRDILGFLGLHPDGSAWGSVFERRRNRSVDAARVFGAFAKEHPDRAKRLIQKMAPGDMERPVEHAISEMSQRDDVLPEEIVGLVMELHNRGFSSPHFRHGAAWVVAKMASRLGGLDDRVCTTIAGWLAEHTQSERKAQEEAEKPKKDEDRLHPLLWGMGGMRILPGGNYPVLHALEVGFLLRSPPAADLWLAILEEHLERCENPKVWTAAADNLRFLQHADRERAVAFLERLFEKEPALSGSIEGLRLLAWTHRWLPAPVVHRWITKLLSGDWDRAQQAAGEFVMLRAFTVPEDPLPAAMLEEWIGSTTVGIETSDFVFGIACTVAGVWPEVACRSAATSWIERLAPLADHKLATGLRSIFSLHQGKPCDVATERVLRACRASNAILTSDQHFLPVLLKSSLRDGIDPFLVGEVALSMVKANGGEEPNQGSRWASSSSDLFEIATALQRIEAARHIGTELFEALLALEVYGIEEHMGRFDRNRFG